MPNFARPIAAAGLAALTLSAAAACGSSSSGGSGSTVSPQASSPSGVNSAAVALLPAPVKAKGTLVVAADATYAPNEFVGNDGKTIEGMDADLAEAIGKALGLKVTLTNETFDGIIPGIAAGKYDVGMSSFTDTKEREQTVDFVDYFQAGTSFFEKAEGGPTVTGLDGLCGLKVAVEKGTTQQDDATAQSKKCTKAGKAAVTVDTFPDQNGANLALQSGHDQVGMADSPVAAYQVKKSDGQFKLVGTAYGVAPYGIALPKGTGLTQAVKTAVQGLIDDGSYLTILDKWGVESGAIKTATVNQAIS
ncbi:MAG TPA: ABC transporter substrate-binding protein [Mycobacteriales bacterium]|jgi:polar amino acid transport system substrate-binding protein|nr:ABC transporter substrate-binding protein [Mycobacteriales bacterium]